MKAEESVFEPAWNDRGRAELLNRRVDRLAWRCMVLECACATLAAAVAASWLTRPAPPPPVESVAGIPRQVVAGRLVADEVVATKVTLMDEHGDVYGELARAGKQGALTVREAGSDAHVTIRPDGTWRVDAEGRSSRDPR